MRLHRNVFLLLSISFLQGLVFYAAIPALYRQQYGLSFSDIFLIESISWVLTFLLEIPWGYVSDRYGYKKTLVISHFIFFLSKIVFYLSTSFSLFLLERIFLAVALSGLSGCDSAMLYESSGGKQKEKYFGYFRALSTAGLVLASLSLPLVIAFSLRMTAFLTIFPYGISWILTLFLKEVKSPERKKVPLLWSVKSVLANPGMMIFLILAAVISEFAFSVSVFLNQAQYTRSGLPVRYFGVLNALMQIIPIASAGAHRIIRRIGKEKIILLVILAGLMSGMTLALTSSIVLSVFSIALLVLASALFQPVSYAIQNEHLKDDNRATALSVYAMIMEGTSAGINLVIGKTADTGISRAFFFLTGTLLSIGAVYYLFNRKRSQASQTG